MVGCLKRAQHRGGPVGSLFGSLNAEVEPTVALGCLERCSYLLHIVLLYNYLRHGLQGVLWRCTFSERLPVSFGSYLRTVIKMRRTGKPQQRRLLLSLCSQLHISCFKCLETPSQAMCNTESRFCWRPTWSLCSAGFRHFCRIDPVVVLFGKRRSTKTPSAYKCCAGCFCFKVTL